MESSRNSFPLGEAASWLLIVLVLLGAGALFLRAYASRAIGFEREVKVVEAPLLKVEAARAEQDARLEQNYHWVDREAGRVGMPIERAMELVVEDRGGAR